MNPATTPSKPITTTTASTTSVFRSGIIRNNSNDNNPFLETPARKLFKHHHHHDSTNNSSGAFSGSGYTHQQGPTSSSSSSAFVRGLSGGSHALATGGVAGAAAPSLSSSRKPQRLVLTRVMPSSTTTSNNTSSSIPPSAITPVLGMGSVPATVATATGGGGGGKGVVLASSPAEPSYMSTLTTSSPFATTTTKTTTHVKDSHRFIIPSAPAFRPSGKTPRVHQQQHPSTTPKGPPNQHYLELLAKSLESEPAPKLDLGFVSVRGEGKEKLQDQDQEQEQEQEQERPVEAVPPANSRMMDFARKSIMQHSAAAPGSIFRKLGNKAGSQQSLTHSQARSLINSNHENRTLPQPSVTSKPTPPVQPPVQPLAVSKPTTAKAVSPQDRMTAKHPKESAAAQDIVNRWEPAGDLAFRFVPSPKPSINPAAAATVPTTTLRQLTSETSAPHVFSRSVLDFSGSSVPKFQRKSALNASTTLAAATSITSNNNNVNSSNSFSKPIYPNKAYQPPSMTATLTDISSATENRMPPTTATTTKATTATTAVDVEMDDGGAEGSGDTQRSSPAFDIRAALRMDSARTQYQLPNLIASLSPPPSPRRRPTPYSIPSANDREALRIRRTPGFKARPLNPKIFTGAGDLGLPKIQKPALTVPVSPVFSQRKRVKDVVSTEGLSKGKDVSVSAAAMRLKEMVGAGAVEKQNRKQQKQQQDQIGGRQVISAGGRQQSSGRIVQPRVVHHAQISRRDISGHKGKDKDFGGGGMGGGARRIEVAGVGRGGQGAFESSLKPASLVVPSVDQTRPDIDVVGTVGSDLGLQHHHHLHNHEVPMSSSAATGGVSKLRRPITTAGGAITRPVPFNFATTELQRKRMLYQPTPSDYSLISTSAPSSSRAVVGSSSLMGSTNGLSLEDLMPNM
ncbi:hypothetical protein K457DRAFT_154046 [Linnemannia elongata AG-77]|uniref:TPX2 central domain-containing protein n=1 Tax=Linnemannia elongata AG-77 TaxID=1314771 RepID=A0A197K5I3_9FUNG|nr:hypothetical protein K457DRAFT_154046 [Linnemannia elongata AG-77]